MSTPGSFRSRVVPAEVEVKELFIHRRHYSGVLPSPSSLQSLTAYDCYLLLLHLICSLDFMFQEQVKL